MNSRPSYYHTHSSFSNNSLAICKEIQRFESVHPSIYAIYDLIELIPDPIVAQQVRDHVVCIEGKFIYIILTVYWLCFYNHCLMQCQGICVQSKGQVLGASGADHSYQEKCRVWTLCSASPISCIIVTTSRCIKKYLGR